MNKEKQLALFIHCNENTIPDIFNFTNVDIEVVNDTNLRGFSKKGKRSDYVFMKFNLNKPLNKNWIEWLCTVFINLGNINCKYFIVGSKCGIWKVKQENLYKKLKTLFKKFNIE